MVTEILLVRHAHSDYSSGNEEERSLSERGHIDSLAVTKLLLKEHVQVVCSSPYTRAAQTVEGAANLLGVLVELDHRFRERDFAEPGYEVEDKVTAIARGFVEPDFAFPGGESNRDVERRGINALNSTLQQHRGKRIAIGIHGGIMTIILHHFDEQFDADFLRNLHKPDVYKLTFRHDEYLGAMKIGDFGVRKG